MSAKWNRNFNDICRYISWFLKFTELIPFAEIINFQNFIAKNVSKSFTVVSKSSVDLLRQLLDENYIRGKFKINLRKTSQRKFKLFVYNCLF